MVPLSSENFHTTNIVILDDSEFDRARICRELKAAQILCAVVQAETLASFEKALEEDSFQIAILDYELPDGTGHDALRHIQSCDKNTALVSIMVTDSCSPRVAEEALRLGCSAVILKSEMKPQSIRQALANALTPGRFPPIRH